MAFVLGSCERATGPNQLHQLGRTAQGCWPERKTAGQRWVSRFTVDRDLPPVPLRLAGGTWLLLGVSPQVAGKTGAPARYAECATPGFQTPARKLDNPGSDTWQISRSRKVPHPFTDRPPEVDSSAGSPPPAQRSWSDSSERGGPPLPRGHRFTRGLGVCSSAANSSLRIHARAPRMSSTMTAL